MRLVLFFILILTFVQKAQAQDKDITLVVPPMLVENGFLKYILPRFSLKTGLSISVETTLGAASAPSANMIPNVTLSLAPPMGAATKTPPLMQGLSETFYVWRTGGMDAPDRLVKWLYSDIGQRTIEAFQINAEQVFFAVEKSAIIVESQPLTGDIAKGEILAFQNCGRCHVIGDRNRMQGLGSTPSFGLLRTFGDWLGRFQQFYALNPHPSFTQIQEITLPFGPLLPPPIHPLVLTQEELQSIIAYVATIPPANLGRPLVHQ